MKPSQETVMLEAVSNTTRSTYDLPAIADGPARRFSDALGALLPALVVLGFSLAFVFLLLRFRESMMNLGNWGYAGVFLAELGNSASVIIPTPGTAYTFAMAAVLNPLLVGFLGGLAAAMGELVGYYLGVKGGSMLPQGRMIERMQSLTTRWGGGALFAFALLPISFDIAGIWAGVTRYPLWRFFMIVAAGKVIKVTAIATSGFYSINWLLQFPG